jgi:septum formation protein
MAWFDPIIPVVRLILASASPRRAELLRAAGFEFETLVADVDERVRADETASRYVRRLAAEKSAASASTVSGFIATDPDAPPEGGRYVVLAADTTVVVDGRILGKPDDDADAARMIRALAGRAHEVMTGVSVRCNAREAGRVETTTVFFAPMSDAEVAWYVASGEGRDKAGGYAIQGLASRFIPRIEGSYSNVVGLPVAAVVELLREVAGETV